MTYPDGEAVTFTYNNNMLPTSVSGTDVYAQSITYDSAMRMIQLVRGANVINTVFTYDPWNVDNGRLQNLTSTQVSTGTQLQNSTYDYDSVGNIETIMDSLSGPQTQTFTYDALDRLLSSDVTGGTEGLYTEGYAYDPSTGNLASKNNLNYTAYDTNHKHAVTNLSNGNSYGYDQNGNMVSRHVLEGTEFKDYTLAYDAENRLVSVTGDATASFVYDGDSKQIKATVDGITTVYVGNHYEVKNNIVTKYYFAGATRLAVRTDGTLRFLLGDHLGSSSVTTNASGAKTASALYKAFGETRYTLGNLSTDYRFTGQREESSLGGIYWFSSRWFDPSLGRFMSPDTIVPTSTQGTQAWDRYAFVNNNPVRYTDPTGHSACNLEPEECEYLGNMNGQSGGNATSDGVGESSGESRGGSDGDGNKSKPPCEMITTQSTCQQISKVLSVTTFGLDTVSGILSLIGSVLELIGLLGGPVGEGGALGVYQVLNAFEGALGGISATITAANDFIFTGESYFTTDPQPELVLGNDTTIAITLAIIGGIDPEAATDTLFNAAVWSNDLYRLRGGEGFLQTHIGLNYFYVDFGQP